MSETKTITFEGRSYTVPVWVGWVARDQDDSVFGFDSAPLINVLDGYFYTESASVKIFPIRDRDQTWRDSLTKV